LDSVRTHYLVRFRIPLRVSAIVICLALDHSTAAAQAASIQSIVNLVRRDARFAPGVLATLRYKPATVFDPAADHVEVGGRTAWASDDFDVLATADGEVGNLTIRLPEDLTPGPAAVVLVTNGEHSAPVPIQVERYAPGVLAPSRMTSNPFVSEFGCHLSATTGETLTLIATGLGSAAVSDATLTVGTRTAQIVEITETRVPGFAGGWHRIRFVVPPGDGGHLVALTVNGERSNYVPLPVGRTMLNLATTTFRQGAAAPGAIETGYACSGGDLAALPFGAIVAAPSSELSAELAGTSVRVVDAAGVDRAAKLYGLSRSQVNYLIPKETAPGLAVITVRSGDRAIASADLEIQTVAPSFFYGSFELLRVRAGVQTIEPVHELTIDMGADTDEVFLMMFGTGFSLANGPRSARASIPGIDVPVLYVGAQGQFPGLDQLNVRLPRELKGRGWVVLKLTIDGQEAGDLSLQFR
jgi:uncharacterized protein (TIGR03437 family)